MTKRQHCTWTDFSRSATHGRRCRQHATHRHRLNEKCADLSRYLCADHSTSASQAGIVGELLETQPEGWPMGRGC